MGHDKTVQGTWPRVFPHQLSWLIDNPLRRMIISPETLIARLKLKRTSRVLELGPGSGYFSVALAASVPEGRLELFDIQPEMLAKTERKIQALGLANVGYSLGHAGEGLPFPDGSFDIVLLCSVLGEVPDRAGCLNSLARVLNPAGRLAFHESIPDPDRIPFKQLQGLLASQGFQLHQRWGRAWNYTATFVVSQPIV